MIELLRNPLRVDPVILTGTVVVASCARGMVIGVGSNTALGSICDSMLRSEDEVTPLKDKLDEIGTFLAKGKAGICVLLWLVNIGHFHDPSHGGFFQGALHYFKIAVALAVAAVPKGLPSVVTLCLALGTKRMACLNAIVRSLPSNRMLCQHFQMRRHSHALRRSWGSHLTPSTHLYLHILLPLPVWVRVIKLNGSIRGRMLLCKCNVSELKML
ncbi:hypothetical protein Nepgr_031492 [Nepenthes gracilis]|uniref:Uncharacterized protein n=1 Tax=Nepenthes gracilis TaxID=150966 RepID=A0AAD3TI94_NEPGR|nr:hypothetical protein Nepgr_031492 [Nepenthes gracilis]